MLYVQLKVISAIKKHFIMFILAEEFFIVILYPIEPIDQYDTK